MITNVDLHAFIPFSLDYNRGLYHQTKGGWWKEFNRGTAKDGEVCLCHDITMTVQECCSRFWITCNIGNDQKQPLPQQVLSGEEAGGYLPSEVRKKALDGL